MNKIKQIPSATFAVAINFLTFFLIHNSTKAQTIYGPDNDTVGSYYVDTIGVDIKYVWNVEGGYISDSVGVYDDTVVIHWTDTIRKIQVKELPQFANNTINITQAPYNANGNDTIADNIAIQNAVKKLDSLGGGTLEIPSGTYYFNSMAYLPTGIKIKGIGNPELKFSTANLNTAGHIFSTEGYWYGGNNYYSFISNSNKNSKPIEIEGITFNGDSQNPVQNPYQNSQYEHASLIHLRGQNNIYYIRNDSPPGYPGNIAVNGTLISGYLFLDSITYDIWAYVISPTTGTGKLKTFIHDCTFKNSTSDGVLSTTNVDLSLYNCNSENVFRGGATITGGNTKVKVKNLTAQGNIDPKAIDFETDEPGNNNVWPWRAWVDSCNLLDGGADFDYDHSNLLLTNMNLQVGGQFVFEGNMGDLIARNCNFNYYAAQDAGSNYILGPSCGRYYDCNFKVFSPTDSCKNFNGMLFRNKAGALILDSKLGFQNCTFGADPVTFAGNTNPKFGIYKENQPSNYGQFFFKNCTNVNNTLDSLLANVVPIGPGAPPICQSSNQTFQSNVLFKDSMLVCGETEDTMKSYFGIRKVYVLHWSSVSVLNVTCNNAANATVTANANGMPGIVSYVLSPAGNNPPNNTGNFTNLAPGIYTITATDIANYSISTTVTITQPTAIALTSSATDAACNGDNGELIFSASGGTGIISFKVNGISQVSPFATVAGTYTIVATDANLCTASTILTITQPVALIWSNVSFNNITCNDPLADNGGIAVLATGGTGTISYNLVWNGPPGLYNLTGIFSPIVAHIYTVTATDANGCTITTVVDIIDPLSGNFCCSPAADSVVATPNVILKIAPLATQMLAQYGVGNTITGKTIYIDDVFTIDSNITFNGCTLWFTPTGQIQLSAGADLYLENNTILQASCYWWGGIVGTDAGNKVSMKQNSTIKNSNLGIHLLNNAILEVENSHFIDNGHDDIYLSNMTLNPYPGYIRSNTFSTQQNLPNGPFPKTQTAIELINVKNINIGDPNDTTSVNTFSGMCTGILALSSNFIAGTCEIGLYNNKFENIKDSIGANIISNVYTNKKGAGVYLDYSNAPMLDVKATVSYTGYHTTPNETFRNCDKAIVCQGANLIDSNMYLKNCIFGIMNQSLMSKRSVIQNNVIDTTYIGIQLIGDFKNYNIKNNSIKAQLEPCNNFAPIGIDVQKYSNAPNITDTLQIVGNTIELTSFVGKGIRNMNGSSRLYVAHNSIKLTTTETHRLRCGNNGGVDYALYGIYSSNSDGTTFESNRVDGLSNLVVYNAQFSRGMYFEYSPNCKIQCNKVRYTKQGLYGWGDNTTDKYNIKDNKFKYNTNPLFTLDQGAALPGTFGNIGDGIAENGNDWLYNTNNTSWLLNGTYRIWRHSSGATMPHFIKTGSNFLVWQWSGSNVVNFHYDVQNINASYSDPCPDPLFVNAQDNNATVYYPIDWASMDVENATAIATDSLNYIAYAEVGEWLNNHTLYDRLQADTALRNSSYILTSFYNNFQQTIIDNISKTDIAMAILFDFKGSYENFSAQYYDALTQNTTISSNNNYENYEQTVNAIALSIAMYGKDSVSVGQQMELEVLANMCPYIGGSAVYKARTLWAMYQPNAQYNDRLMCLQGQGQNKNQDWSNINLDSLYESEVQQNANALSAQINTNSKANSIQKPITTANASLVSVYPNPASTQIIISYSSKTDGYFKLYNAFGEVILSTTLTKDVSKAHLQINDIANGIYHYEIEFANMKNAFGKLTILK